MSVREERLILTAAALIGMGRDDRHSPDSAAAYAVARADACLSRLDETEPEEDSDGDVTPSEESIDKAYDEGFADGEARTQTKLREDLLAAATANRAELEAKILEARETLRAQRVELESANKMLAAATAPKPPELPTKPDK